jgi:hypothetical protein
MYSRLIAAALCILPLSFHSLAEPMPGHNEPANRQLPDGGHLAFHQTVTLRGVLSYGRNRKLTPAPEESFADYMLSTPVAYTTVLPMSARETHLRTGVSTFWIKAPHEISLLWYRNRQVQISGRLIPDGRFHSPTLIVDSIRIIRGAAANI